MKDKLNRFMQGRYGVDNLSRFILIIYTYFRILSRNISARYAENQKYLGYTQKIRSWFTREKNMMEQRKTHHIYTCPGCGQKIRIPRGKGQKVEIECPKCHEKFIKRR